MSNNPRCLYNNSFSGFLNEAGMTILGKLVEHYHGEARTTTIEAWKGEISIRTIGYILQVIQKSKNEQKKSICFVTGVPGAGKTLVGLDVAIKQTYQGHDEPVEDEGAVYLSGNGPLVSVLTEALAQDNYKKSHENNEPKKLSDSRREVRKSIQMIHRYPPSGVLRWYISIHEEYRN